MNDLETHCLNMLDFAIPVFYRYVDNIFTIIPVTKVNEVLDIFNNHHPHLKFTHEVQSNNSIPFLDTNLIRDGNCLITD